MNKSHFSYFNCILILISAITILPAISLCGAEDAIARKIRLRLGNTSSAISKNRDSDKTPVPAQDYLTFDITEEYKDKIIFSGYDKVASSAKESLCITNDSPETITAMKIEITYSDLQGRMIHKREVEIPVTIPSGETRTATFSHYDPQKSLYYYRSRPPRSGGIPFSASVTLIALALE